MNNIENLTELEKKVLTDLSFSDEYDGLPTDSILNIKAGTGIDTKILRGVLTSLRQKGLVSITQLPNGVTGFQYIK